MSFPTIRRGGAFLTGGLLSVALMAVPAVAVAQPNVAPAAMVEASPTDINAWGFAARVPVGATATWTNLGAQPHSATSADGTCDTGLVTQGSSGTGQFDT